VIGCPDPSKGRPTLDGVCKNGIQLHAKALVTVRTKLDRLVGGATEETIIARVGEGIVKAIGSAENHTDVLANPNIISQAVLKNSLDSQTAFEIVSIDVAEIDVGDNIAVRRERYPFFVNANSPDNSGLLRKCSFGQRERSYCAYKHSFLRGVLLLLRDGKADVIAHRRIGRPARADISATPMPPPYPWLWPSSPTPARRKSSPGRVLVRGWEGHEDGMGCETRRQLPIYPSRYSEDGSEGKSRRSTLDAAFGLPKISTLDSRLHLRKLPDHPGLIVEGSRDFGLNGCRVGWHSLWGAASRNVLTCKALFRGPSRPPKTARTGSSVSRGKRQRETGENLGHHLHFGL
jgi:hypothetical protein